MSQNLAPLFGQGINKMYGIMVKTYSPFYTRMLKDLPMTGRILDQQQWEGYQLPQETLALNPAYMSQIQPSYSKRYFPVKRTIGDVVAEEDWEDDEYGFLKRIIPAAGGGFAQVVLAKKEYDAANMFAVLGFSAASPVPMSFDGVSLFNTSHPISKANSGTTASNTPSVAADLSNTSYYAAYANMTQQMATNNKVIISSSPKNLVVNPKQREVANQIVKGDWERVTLATSLMNAAKEDNLNLIMNPYFRKTGATSAANSWNGWFIQGDDHTCMWANRQDFRVKSDYDINLGGYIWVGSMRYDFGWSDWRSTFGSPGA